MTRNFYLGCAVWSYKGWVGEFYPPKTAAKDFLSLYSRRFTAVEGNTTFYAVPEQATVARWAAQTPPGFKFCPKLPKTITHGGLLASQVESAQRFIERMGNLGDKLGPIFVQLPPRYSPSNLNDLQQFLQALQPMGVPLAVEVRHPDWFGEPHKQNLLAVLHATKTERVLLDTRPIYNCADDPQITSERRKPNVPLQPDEPHSFGFVRFISHPDAQYNQVYLQEWTQRITQWLHSGKQVYFFVHCPVEDFSPATARDFQKMLIAQNVPVPELPWDSFNPPPQQLSLF
jgi:uncharacterized protein YecE (DUF72 family)